MRSVNVDLPGVAASLVLVAAAVGLSSWERLGLERSIIWAAARALGQMLAIGAALGLVLDDDAPLFLSWLWVIAMVGIGAVTVASRVRQVPGLVRLAALSLGAAEAVALLVVFALGIFPLQARAIVPTAGMVMGNAIAATVTAARRTYTEISEHRELIEVRLSLGHRAADAVRPHLAEALRTAVGPQIEQTKIVGLVALPGTMTGLLLAGVDPLDAVLAQTVVMFLILGSVAMTSVAVGRGVAHKLVTPDHRLVLPEPTTATLDRR
jgi:putative ABC transport system permease protein